MRRVYHSDEERQEARRTYDRNRTQPYERQERRHNPRNNSRPAPTREGYRICNDCGEKPLIEFRLRNGKPLAICIECERARDRERNALRRVRKPPKEPKSPRERSSASPEEKAAKKAYNDAYREANREDLQAYDRARHNTDEHRARRRERNRPKVEARRAQKELDKLNAPPPIPPTEKLCPSCNPPIPKKVSEFGKDKNRPFGIAAICKECAGKKSHAYLDKRREYNHNRPPEAKHAQYEAGLQWRREHPIAVQGYQLQRLARKRHAKVIDTVDYNAIVKQYGMYCYICNQPILPHHTLTFDHIVPLIPRKGEPQGTHTSENIRPAHRECNGRKSNRRFEGLTDFDKRGIDY